VHFKKIGVFAAVLMVAVTAAIAEVPSRINFQGRLLDQNKNPRSGLFNMVFTVWDTGPGTGGSAVWTETQNNVPVTNGMFAVQLGAMTPLSAAVFSSTAVGWNTDWGRDSEPPGTDGDRSVYFRRGSGGYGG
jgi:hypothetical protein